MARLSSKLTCSLMSKYYKLNTTNIHLSVLYL